MKRIFAFLLTLSIVFSVSPPMGNAGGAGSPLRQVLPEDCLILVEAPSYRTFCEQIAVVFQRVNPMATWKDIDNQLDGLGLPEGVLVEQGPAGMAFFEIDEDTSPVTLFQIRDKKIFLDKTLHAVKKSDGPDDDGLYWYAPRFSTMHFAIIGNIVAMSENRDSVLKISKNQKAKKPTRMRATNLTGGLIVTANLKQVNALYREKINEGFENARKQFHAQLDEKKKDNEKEINKEAKEMMSSMATMMDALKVVNDTLDVSEETSLSLLVDKAGITLNFDYVANPKSELGKSLAKLENVVPAGMKFLPKESLMYQDSSHVAPVQEEMVAFILGLLKGNEQFKPFADSLSKLLSNWKGSRSSGFIPSQGKGLGTFIYLLDTKDTETFLNEVDTFSSQYFVFLKKITEEFGDIKFDIQHKPRKEAFKYKKSTVWNTAFSLELKSDGDGDDEMMNPMMQMQIGPLNALYADMYKKGFYSTSYKDYVIFAGGSDPEKWIKAVIDNIDKGKPVLTESPVYKKSFRTDPEGAFAVGNFNVLQLVGAFAGIAGDMVPMPPKQVKPIIAMVKQIAAQSNSAIGTQMRVTNGRVVGEVHIPSQHITELVGLGGALMMRMQAMQQGGGAEDDGDDDFGDFEDDEEDVSSRDFEKELESLDNLEVDDSDLE